MNNKEGKFSLAVFRQLVKSGFRLGKTFWKEKKGMIIALLIVFVGASAAPFAESAARGWLINELVKSNGIGAVSRDLGLAAALFILAVFVFPLITTFQNYLLRIFFFFTGREMELAIVKKKGEVDIATHENPKINDLFNKVTEQGVWRASNFAERQFYLFQNILEVAIASVIIAFSQWWLLLIIVAGEIPGLITELAYGRDVWGIHSARAETRRRYWEIHRHFNWVPGLIELKIFQNIPYLLSSIKDLFIKFMEEEVRNERKKLFYRLLSVITSYIAMGFIIGWFVFQTINGNILVGTFTFLVASAMGMRQAFYSLFSNLGRQYQDGLFINDVFNFLDIKPAIPKPAKGITLDQNKTPEIIFDRVSFSYPDSSKQALKNFSLKIPPGEKIALVGLNGAGKTTFVKLLCRFYDPTEGKITIDGHDLKDIDLESWYHQLGALFQEYSHYHFLVKEVIALGRTGKPASLEEIKEAAKAAEADIFIEEWEKNYEQMLGKEFTEGVQPSIGQWQKLALARTFYRDPRVLILDEPTSSIDAEAEAKIFDKLESLPKDRSVIIISHRFSTVRHANQIVVIENGEIKEKGAHEELIRLNGIYAELFNLQAVGYK